MATRHRFSKDDQRSAFSGNVRLWEKQIVNVCKDNDTQIMVQAWVPTGVALTVYVETVAAAIVRL